MEERKKRNVEEVVSKLRQPAVITDRRTSRSNRQFETLPISVYHSQYKSEFRPPKPPVKASSLLSLVGQCADADEKGEKVIYKNFNFDEVKDSFTQTSKTIIELAKLEEAEMSPDSLSPSPRRDGKNFDTFTLDGSVYYGTCGLNRKSSNAIDYYQQNLNNNEIIITDKQSTVVQYYPNLNDNDIVDEDIPTQNSPANEFPRKSLIETYLERSKNRINKVNNEFKKTSSSKSGDKFKCLEPVTPLKLIINEEPIQNNFKLDVDEEPAEHNFKSQSLVDSYNQNFMVSAENTKSKPQFTRFTVSNIREKNQINVTYRDTIYERTSVASTQQTKRSNSFMLPTISSERKSKMDEIRQIKHLILPIRRGRSGSPRTVTNKVEYFRVENENIPYIDVNKAEISKIPQRIMSTERKSIVERSKSPNTISPFLPANDFQRDMSRIDQMSITLPPSSDDSISARTRGTDVMSLSTVENSISEVMCRIHDTDWNISLKGLADATELCRSLETDIMVPYMLNINQKLIELLRSPRSHVCRTSCQAAGHLFESMKDTRGPEFNEIVDILLGKTADANKFIRQDANLALDCMVTHVPTFHAIRALCSRGPVHKNHLVRCATVRLIICAVVIAGPDCILNPNVNEHTRRRIFTNMMRFLEDKNLETRKYGERLYKVLSKEPNFDQYLRKYIDRDDLTRLKKTLKFLVKKK